MKYKIFLCDLTGERCDPKELSRNLCAEAVNAYCRMEKIDMTGSGDENGYRPEDFLEEKNGKPYLEGHPLHFNVSHSGLLWLCIAGGAPCGIDIQQEKDCSYEKIAARHFSKEEQAYIKEKGLSGFFRLWTMKEAYGKYTGKGFYGQMPPLIGEDGKPVSEISGAFIREIEIGPGIYCAYCTGGKDDEIQFIG